MFQYIENLSNENRLLKTEVVRLKTRVEELQLLNADLWTCIQKQITTRQIDDPYYQITTSTILHDHPICKTDVTKSMASNVTTDTYVLVDSPDNIVECNVTK